MRTSLRLRGSQWPKGLVLCSLVASLLCCSANVLHAQRYFFENIGVQQGLPASKVYATVQDGFGVVWVGTEAGLASYDGNAVTNHGTQEGLAPNGARSLLIDKEGHLWVGHLDGGISYYDGQRFRAFSVGKDMHSAITGLAQTADGRIWVSTAGNGAYAFSGAPEEGGELKATSFGEAQGLQQVLLNVVVLSEDRLCFIQDRGSIRTKATTGDSFSDLQLPGWQGLFECSALFQDKKGDRKSVV